MALITAENVSKEYRTGEITVRALRGVSFDIEPASFVSFVGPSGSGKTTLLNLIGCLDKPTEGTLKVADADVSAMDRGQRAAFRESRIAFSMIHDPCHTGVSSFPRFRAWANLSSPRERDGPASGTTCRFEPGGNVKCYVS